MTDHVSQPVAEKLRAAGWEWETEKCYDLGVYPKGNKLSTWPFNCTVDHPDLLPAPSIGELRERLTKEDFENYIIGHSLGYNSAYDWLYTVTASADELAEVWLWVHSNKKGE